MRVGIRAEQELLQDAAALRELDSQLKLEPGAFQAECEKYMRQYWQWDKERIVEAFQDLFDIDWAQRFPDQPAAEAGPSNAIEHRPDLLFAHGPAGIAYVEVDTTDIQLPLKASAEAGADSEDVDADVAMQPPPPSVDTPYGVYTFQRATLRFLLTIDCLCAKPLMLSKCRCFCSKLGFLLKTHPSALN